jgi:hypothetical protein
MKIKAIITVLLFAGALFSGSVIAADRGATENAPQADTRGGAAEGQRGVPMQEARPGQPAQDQQQPMAQDRQTQQDPQAGVAGQDQDEIAGMHKAEDVMGKTVVSQTGEELGSVDDLVIAEDGQVQYIILSRGGTLGIGGDLIPIPWDAANLQIDQENDQLRADITEQQLEGAPKIEGGNWAQIASPEYEQQVHSYYGTEPRQDQGFQSPQMSPQAPRN